MDTLDSLQQRLANARGPAYWRTLEELASTADFRALVAEKLPSALAILDEGIDRRRFLGLLAASLALAGIGGCAQAPVERVNPYVRAPEEIVPGRPLYFATAMPLAGYTNGGLLVESHMGRPTKVEGDPGHPCSPAPAITPRRAQFGPSDRFAQASILSLYDPDRSAAPQHFGDISAWGTFGSALNEALRRRSANELRLRILTGTVTSPTYADLMRRVLSRFPQARWHQWEPAGRWNVLEGAYRAFGRYVETHYQLGQADRILALDSDFLSCPTSPLIYARDFGDRRRVWNQSERPSMNRLYVVESMPTGTGAKADHRVPLRCGQVETFTRAVASRLGIAVGQVATDDAFSLPAGWLDAMVLDLSRQSGKSVVLCGETQPPVVHALAHAINERLGAFGQTVRHTAPIAIAPVTAQGNPPVGTHDQIASLGRLVDAMNADDVDILLMLGGNPAYTAPVDLEFDRAMQRMRQRRLLIHLSPYFDETSALCHWHLNQAHYLESWGDVRSHDGTVSILQPLIAPLYFGRTELELLSMFIGSYQQGGLELLRSHWRSVFNGDAETQAERSSYSNFRPSGDFETWWRRSVHDGRIEGTQAVIVSGMAVCGDFSGGPGAQGQGLEIAFRSDASVFDGSFSNNGWMQELPRPFSKITWDNAAYMSPQTAVALTLAPSVAQAGGADGKLVTLRLQGRDVETPVWVLPGHADNAVTVHLGYGRQRAGRVGSGIGFNAYRLRTAVSPWFAGGLAVTETGRTAALAATHGHHLMENRELIRSDILPNFRRRAEEAHANRSREMISLYPPHDYADHKWGMAIDLNACTGCQACVIACQSENNIPVVGKDQVSRGREMHWLRIDTYYQGSPERPLTLQAHHQPVLCMHCENAPCELVCPVEATVHSDEGLNDMVYNRCVGTRYCSNNCPYKVRRFNFLQFADFTDEHQRLMRNPDVTVRSRGVMEKCTYCVQRIRETQIIARRDGPQGRPIEDGEIQTACQAACPLGAIVFGDLNQRGSKVKAMQDHDLNYSLLGDLNTRPRTTYLWSFKNPNPAIERLFTV